MTDGELLEKAGGVIGYLSAHEMAGMCAVVSRMAARICALQADLEDARTPGPATAKVLEVFRREVEFNSSDWLTDADLRAFIAEHDADRGEGQGAKDHEPQGPRATTGEG